MHPFCRYSMMVIRSERSLSIQKAWIQMKNWGKSREHCMQYSMYCDTSFSSTRSS